MEILNKSIGSFSVSVSFSQNVLTLSGGDPALGLSLSVGISEAQLLAAGLKLIPAGVASEVAGAAVAVIEGATESL